MLRQFAVVRNDMIRTFKTHNIRCSEELSGKFWNVKLLDKHEGADCFKAFVPGCIENIPGLANYRGKIEYTTDFTTCGNTRIEFKGVSHFAEVYIDDEFIGNHYGSYTSFSVVKSALTAGNHKLKVVADNSFGQQYALDVPNDYMSYGGISRGVLVEDIPSVYIDYIHVTPAKKAGKWTASVEVKLSAAVTGLYSGANPCENSIDKSGAYTLQLEIAGVTQSVNISDSLIYNFEFDFDKVNEWNIDTPSLYYVTAIILADNKPVDDLIDRFGFREVGYNLKNILINDKPVRIKGFCRHEDHPEYGCAIPAAEMAHDLALMKDMGANSVRTSHYPNDELFLDMCDELGFLVWEEEHARGHEIEVMYNPNYLPQSLECIKEMIRDHYNHPAIYIWGIQNECASQHEDGRKMYEAMYNLIASLDQSRPYSSASCKFFTDICQDLEPICAWNIYPYWYVTDTASELVEGLNNYVKEKTGEFKPFLVTEIGAGAIPGFRSPSLEKWSEERQAKILHDQLTEVLSHERCIGVYIWQYCDVRVHEEWSMKRPRTMNNKGIVDEYRRPKLAYNTVKEIFNSF